MRAYCLILLLLFGCGVHSRRSVSAKAEASSPAAAILSEVTEGDLRSITKALSEVDELLKKDPNNAENYYARGVLLYQLSRIDESIEAQKKAISLDPTFAEAYAEIGFILLDKNQGKEACLMFDSATGANPKFFEGYYNAGQCYYDLKLFEEALSRWGKACALVPDDFGATKKLIQAQFALGRYEEAAKSKAVLYKIKKDSSDPNIIALEEYVFDQFVVDGATVFAYETFEPSGMIYYVYTFKVFNEAGKIVKTVQLESSVVTQSAGVPYIIGISEPNRHSTTSIMFKALPTYDVLKPVIIDGIRGKLPVSASSITR